MRKYKGLLTPLIILITILLSESILTGLLPVTRGGVFEMLEAKNVGVWLAIGFYFCNYLFLDFFQAIKSYFVLKVSLWFRTRRTHLICRKGVKKDIDTVPQRIQEDVKLSYLSRLTVYCEYFVSGIILIYLIVMNLDVPVLVGAGILYAVVSVGIAYAFNPRLNRAEQMSQEHEAKFRNTLLQKLTPRFLKKTNEAVRRAQVIRTQYLLFTKLQLGLMTVLPYIVLIPQLFAGEINLGDLVQHQATFSLIVVNAAILIQYYTILIQGKASEDRVQIVERK